MDIEIKEDTQELVFRKVYNSISFETENKEMISICMRDSGFEFNYNGTWYEAKNGIVKERKSYNDEKN